MYLNCQDKNFFFLNFIVLSFRKCYNEHFSFLEVCREKAQFPNYLGEKDGTLSTIMSNCFFRTKLGPLLWSRFSDSFKFQFKKTDLLIYVKRKYSYDELTILVTLYSGARTSHSEYNSEHCFDVSHLFFHFDLSNHFSCRT